MAQNATAAAAAGLPHPGDQYEIPSVEAHGSFDSLKERIKKHYEIASDYYYSLWGQHIHHGLFRSADETKEQAQANLIDFLLEISNGGAGAEAETGATPFPRPGTRVLDVGCGLGGTSRFLARERGCRVTGITISGRQVAMARQATAAEVAGLAAGGAGDAAAAAATADGFLAYPGGGGARFLELDAETMRAHFDPGPGAPAPFDCVWITEALSHLPAKEGFFAAAFALLRGGGAGADAGLLVIADWFKAPGLDPAREAADLRPIEDGMLVPRLYTIDEYVGLAEQAGFRLRGAPVDISKDVARTWDISWSLVSSPALWAFAISQGRDGLAFLQAFRAMRRGYANGSFRYAVMCFEKP
ncbi:S-adenosyl-L-methionine-dependent methyltransferase [Durotheca rogersii]|uniref:S-adenosyl-L-methionine-dependent methyltransferase n=1 Tax=Durotheca rogersii TaxID=419775 RepID=UPI002220CC1F|nr:S-adenosyl-L-methionine-dependent methyltransferase [Durotheca rogersii]KAI5865470.1 S-adenosyl-L-methionine-dependent methyltransferase [Durotheca rogersii]